MKIKSIKKCDLEMTVDIEVEDTHTYQFGNGAVSHNTISKLFGLTEGVHLPAMRQYLRWVQFRHDDPLVAEYRSRGYPVRSLETYKGTDIVGFPTQPGITALAESLGLEDKVVTAPEATPDEQFAWLRLLEKWWIRGGPSVDTGNQLSYTLKFFPDRVSRSAFGDMMAKHMPTVKCVSVMPSGDTSAYEYLPEQALPKHDYERMAATIEAANKGETMVESIDQVHVECEGGACPISFSKSGV